MKRIFISFLASVMMLALGNEALAQQDRNRNRNDQNQQRSERTTQDRGQRSTEPARTTNRGNNQGQVRQTQRDRSQRNVQPNQTTNRTGNRDQVRPNDRSQRPATTRSRTTNRDNDRVQQQTQRNRGSVYQGSVYTQGRERYSRPRPGYMPTPRYGNGYVYRRYQRSYSRPRFIFFARLPYIISQNILYRNCRNESILVINLSSYPRQILINDWPYPLVNGGYILYPGQSVWIPVPSCPPYDINTSILMNGVWYREDVYMGNGSELILSDDPN